MGSLTVRETLMYASQLKRCNCGGEKQKARVDYLITLMGLNSCADTKVGSIFFKGISGGYLKHSFFCLHFVPNCVSTVVWIGTVDTNELFRVDFAKIFAFQTKSKNFGGKCLSFLSFEN